MALRRAGESSGAGVRQLSGRPSPTYPTNVPSRDTPPRPLPIQDSEEPHELCDLCGSYWVDPLQSVQGGWFTGLHVNWCSPYRECPMPWRTPTVEDEPARFVIEAELSDLSHAELCRRHRISRPTGYKWIRVFRGRGIRGLRDHMSIRSISSQEARHIGLPHSLKTS